MERAALVGWAMSGLMLCGVPVSAQIINPRLVEFAPSPDHWTVIDDTDIVTDYVLQVFEFGWTEPNYQRPLGKPDPVDGRIRVDVGFDLYYRSHLSTGSYESRVAARGPAGTTTSVEFSPFNINRTIPYRPSPPAAVVVGAQ